MLNERALSLRGTIKVAAVVADAPDRANIGKVAKVEETENVRLMVVNTGANAFQGGRVQGTSFGADAEDAYWDDLTQNQGIVALAAGAKFSEVYQAKGYRFLRVQAFTAGGGTADVAWTGC